MLYNIILYHIILYHIILLIDGGFVSSDEGIDAAPDKPEEYGEEPADKVKGKEENLDSGHCENGQG